MISISNDEFARKDAKEDGRLQDRKSEYDRAYRMGNKDKLKESKRHYHNLNKTRIPEKKRLYYFRNKDKVLESTRYYYIRNKSQVNHAMREYYVRNKDQMKELNRQYHVRNKFKIRESKRENYLRHHAHPEAYLPRSNMTVNSWKTAAEVRGYFDTIAKHLRILDYSDWYRISRIQIAHFGGM
jgi:hypothetical protein